MKKLFFALILLFAVSCLYNTEANAEATSIELGKKVSNSFTHDGQLDTYSFTVKKSGKIKATVTSYNNTLDFEIYSSEGGQLIGLTNFTNAKNSNGEINTANQYLEPGTYIVEVSNHRKNTAASKDYSFQIDFTDTKTTEKEPNNDIDEANVLTLNSSKYSTGQISWNDGVDYYKVTMKKSGYLFFNVNAKFSNARIQLLDENLYSIDSNNSYSNSAALKVGDYVEKGTYYLKVTGGGTGTYTVKANLTAANNTEKEPNNAINQAETVQTNNKIRTGLISWNDAEDFYKIVVPKKTAVHLSMWSGVGGMKAQMYNSKYEKISSEFYLSSAGETFAPILSKGTYYVRFYTTYQLGTYKFSVKINVNPSLTLHTIQYKKKKISGKTEGKAKVKIYVNNKLVKTIQTKSNGQYAYTHKKLKVKDKVKVIATNTAGGKTTKQVTVKKK